MRIHVQALNLTQGTRLAEHARLANDPWTRLVGLLCDKSLSAGDGLWIVPCNSIHSIGMRFLFDAVFLSRDGKVVHLISEMKAWRASPLIFSAHSVLELPAGVIASTQTALGDQLEMKRKVK